MKKQMSTHDRAAAFVLLRIISDLEQTVCCDTLISPAKRALQKLMNRAVFDDKTICKTDSCGELCYYPNGLVETPAGYRTVLAPYPIPGQPGRKLGPEPTSPAISKLPRKARRRYSNVPVGTLIKHALKHYPTIAVQYYMAKGKKPPKYPKFQGNLITDESMKAVANFCQVLESTNEDTRTNGVVWNTFIEASQLLRNAVSAYAVSTSHDNINFYQIKCCLLEITPEAIAMIDEAQENGRISRLPWNFGDNVAKACRCQQLAWQCVGYDPHNYTLPVEWIYTLPVEWIRQLGAAYAAFGALNELARDAYVYLGVLQPKEKMKSTQENQHGVPDEERG